MLTYYQIFILLIIFCTHFVSVRGQSTQKEELKVFQGYPKVLEHAENKIKASLHELSFNPSLHPAHTDRNTGLWVKDFMGRERWTSGFFAGSMWYLYKLTGDLFWREHAVEWTNDLESQAYKTSDHDTGFRIFNSFGNGYKIEEGRFYAKTIVQGASTLSKRFDPEIGAIKSWDWVGNYPVIIDNLMNLELLFWSSKFAGRDDLHKLAVEHAETTLTHHLRSDGSTYHVVDFSNSGEVNWKNTFQGYGPESVWTRGQSWAIYGFTMIYRFTNQIKFLDAAVESADFFINNLPDDFVPPFDFLEPEPSVRTKDASAAAISASALFELYSFTNNNTYFNTAVEILHSLSSDKYLTINSNISSILNQSTLHRGQGNLGTSYADYYFLEAIIRYRELTRKQFPSIQKRSPFYLDQNYPNPFNSSTVIFYSLEETGHTEISVYNLAGRKIRTLVDQVQPQGTYRTDFNASGLSSGVYLYRLSVNGKTSTKKMILVE